MIARRTFLGALAAAASAQPARKPNIVILLADDLGYGELGFQGNSEIPTPHLDSIAANGTRFTNGYVTAPYCCPSRAGLLTGRYQTRFGHEMNVVQKQNLNPAIGLPLSERTLADHLKSAGYATAAIGKWHLGSHEQFHPQRRGFDEFFGFLHEGHFYYPPPYRGGITRLRTNEPGYDDHNPILRGNNVVDEPDYLTTAFAREAEAFIDRNRERPFFLYVPFNAIHSPMQAPVAVLKEFEHIKGEQRRLFAAMLRSMDDAVGRVLAHLRAHRLEKNTLIFFLSDNGGPSAELTSSNAPLHGGKGQLYEGGIRVPFAMQWKGHSPAGITDHSPVSSLDILPTALTAAGLPVPESVDGINLFQHREAARTLYWRYGANIAIRNGDWKLVRQGGASAPFQLFHLRDDPGESKNAAETNPAIAAKLRAQLDEWNSQMKPPLW